MRKFIFLLLITTGLASCSRSDVSTSTPSYYVFKDAQTSNRGLVVFVHGLFGDAKESWLNESTNAFFPNLVAKDSTFKGFDVYSYGYYSPKLQSALTINELADEMRSDFEDKNLFKYDNIVFVCHSMGGVLTRAFLLKYRERIAPKVKMIYLIATPSNGSDIANLAAFMSKNKQLEKLNVDLGDGYLSDLSRDWLAVPVLRTIPSYGAYEKLDMGEVIKVVDMTSATALCNRPVNAIAANHIQIAKPDSRTSMTYIVFRNAFKEVFSNTLDVPEVDVDDSVKEQTKELPGGSARTFEEPSRPISTKSSVLKLLQFEIDGTQSSFTRDNLPFAAVGDEKLRTYLLDAEANNHFGLDKNAIFNVTFENISSKDVILNKIVYHVKKTGQVSGGGEGALIPLARYKHTIKWKKGDQIAPLVPPFLIPAHSAESFLLEIVTDKADAGLCWLLNIDFIDTKNHSVSTGEFQLILTGPGTDK